MSDTPPVVFRLPVVSKGFGTVVNPPFPSTHPVESERAEPGLSGGFYTTHLGRTEVK